MPETASSGSATLIKNQIRILELAQGFFESDILFALLKLRVFERLDNAAKTSEQLAAEVGCRADYLARLLNGGRALRLLESEDGSRWRLAPIAQSVLAPSAGEDYLGNWIRWLEFLKSATGGMAEAVLSGSPSIMGDEHLGRNRSDTREFVLAMHNYAALRGRDLANALDTSHCASLLDVGCGPGTYSFQLGSRNPGLELNLLDLPGILEVSREVEASYHLQNTVNYLPMNAMEDPIPGQYDLILVSNILQMLGEEGSRMLLAKLFKNVKPGGSLIIQGQYAEEPTKPIPGRWPVIVDLLQLCMTPHGRNHTPAETMAWMQDTGFTGVEHRRMNLLNVNSYVRGYRPS
jgi:hypothetical protein